jgi:hypothetical protein
MEECAWPARNEVSAAADYGSKALCASGAAIRCQLNASRSDTQDEETYTRQEYAGSRGGVRAPDNELFLKLAIAVSCQRR